jgi:RHS repeat-associated protein
VTATGGKSFTYDSENRLMSMTASGTAVSIIYDGDGNRVAKTVNGVTTQYLVDDLNPTGYPQVMEELEGGAVTRQYTYGLQRIDEDQPISNVWTPSFYGYDGGGSVRQLTNSSGTVTDSYEYDAFGNSFTVSGTTPNEMMYRGEQFDSDLGLYYLRARYYNPLTGRFMSRDMFTGRKGIPVTLHKYLYAGGNPVNFIDPRGRDDVEYAGLIRAAQFGSKFIAAIGCGASLGYYVAESQLDYNGLVSGLGSYWPAPAGVAVGCIYAFTPLGMGGDVGSLAVDIVGTVACTTGIAQAVADYNSLRADEASDSLNYSADLSKFESDWFSSVLGCGATGIGSIWDIGGYFD